MTDEEENEERTRFFPVYKEGAVTIEPETFVLGKPVTDTSIKNALKVKYGLYLRQSFDIPESESPSNIVDWKCPTCLNIYKGTGDQREVECPHCASKKQSDDDRNQNQEYFQTEFCGRCARPLSEIRARVGFTVGDQWDRILCEKCYERAIKRPIHLRYHLWRNKLHNKLQARYLTLYMWYDARRAKLSNKWYAIKYSWDYQTKTWVKLVRRTSVLHWIMLGLIRWRVKEKLGELRSWSDQDAAEHEVIRLTSLYPELVKIVEGELPDLPVEKELSVLEEI